MGDPKDEGSQDLEEKKLEEEALKDTPEDEIKSKIVEDLNLDEEADAELIGKLVSKELEGRKTLSTAIKQKRTWREKAQTEPKPAETPKKPEDTPPPKPSGDVDFDKKLDEVLNKRDLDSLDVSDDTKKAIEFVMNRDGCSVKKAMENGIVKYHLEKDEEKAKTDEASISTSPKGQATTDFSGIKTQEDLRAEIKKLGALDTEEKRKKYKEIMSKVDYKNLK